jgi:hypothetical protein
VVEHLPLRDEPQPPLALLADPVPGEDEVEVADVVGGDDPGPCAGMCSVPLTRTFQRNSRKTASTTPMTNA